MDGWTATPPAPAATRLVRAWQRSRRLAVLGLAALGLFLAALLALHAQSETAPRWHMSEFARFGDGWVWTLGAAGFALCGALVALALDAHVPDSGWKRTGTAFLGLAAAGTLTLALFPVDLPPSHTLSGAIHNAAGPPTFLLGAAAMLVLAPAFWQAPTWRPVAGASATLGVLAFATGILYLVTDTWRVALVAPAQRLVVGTVLVWLTLVAMHLLTLPRPTAGAGDRGTGGHGPPSPR